MTLSAPSQPPANDRLDSWKEIAAHFRRDVRTVKRWEHSEGLPVHRHNHTSRASIYAFRSELDAWWKGRKSARQAPLPVPRTRPPWVVVAAGALVVAGLVGAALLPRSAPLPIASPSGEWVLVTNFENHTADPVFTGLIEGILRETISQSGLASFVPPEHLEDTLRRMRRPVGGPLDMAVGREVALRHGDVRIVIGGSISQMGDAYHLRIQLVEPSESRTVGTTTRDARSPTDVLDVARSIAEWTETSLVEALARDIEPPTRLAEVTTRSFEALTLYSEAMTMVLKGRWNLPVAEELLERALAEDEEFASAHVQLAAVIADQGRPAEKFMPVAERALELAAVTTEQESFFITGLYHQLNSEPELARLSYRKLEELYPSHYWGLRRMAEVSEALGNLDGAAYSMAQAAALRPDSIPANQHAFDFILRTGQLWLASDTYDRLIELQPPDENGNVHPTPQVELFPAHQHLMEGNARAALDEAEQLAEKLDSIPSNIWTRPSALAARLAELYVALGQLRMAETFLERIRRDTTDDPRVTPAIRQRIDQQVRSLIWLSRDTADRCCDTQAQGPMLEPISTILSLRRGQDSNEARDRLRPPPGQPEVPLQQILRGELALADGNVPEAIALLQSGLAQAKGLSAPYHPPFLLGAETLATLLNQDGDQTLRIQVLEHWSGERAKAAAFMFPPTFSHLWVRLRWELARAYRQVGRAQEAASIESYLRSLLAYADEDHDIATQVLKSR